jgi:hypothetical protein
MIAPRQGSSGRCQPSVESVVEAGLILQHRTWTTSRQARRENTSSALSQSVVGHLRGCPDLAEFQARDLRPTLGDRPTTEHGFGTLRTEDG